MPVRNSNYHNNSNNVFVIFQGVYGDGTCNTIDYIEPLVLSEQQRHQHQQQQQQEHATQQYMTTGTDSNQVTRTTATPYLSTFGSNSILNQYDDKNNRIGNDPFSLSYNIDDDKNIVSDAAIATTGSVTETFILKQNDTEEMDTARMSVVTPPPSLSSSLILCDENKIDSKLQLSTTTTTNELSTIVVGIEDNETISTVPTMPENYVPPTKVAKTAVSSSSSLCTTTLEEQITAISIASTNVTTRSIAIDDDITSMENFPQTTSLTSTMNPIMTCENNMEDNDIENEWRKECRFLELYHRKEWYENAISQTTTTTIHSSNTRTDKERYKSTILDPIHCITYDNITNNNHEQSTYTNYNNIEAPTTIPWWMDPKTGCIAVLNQLPTSPTIIPQQQEQVLQSILTKTIPNLMQQEPQQYIPPQEQQQQQIVGALQPGTTVVATEVITLSSYCNNNNNNSTKYAPAPVFSLISITPIISTIKPNHCNPISSAEVVTDDDDDAMSYNKKKSSRDERINDQEDESDSKNGTVPPGRLGWIQLLKIVAPISGYCVLSIDGYSYAGQGLPHNYIPGSIIILDDMEFDNSNEQSTNVDSIESMVIANPPNMKPRTFVDSASSTGSHDSTSGCYVSEMGWYWRVMCIEGAYVRNGIDLVAKHVATIPYGALVRVLRKSINAMGLSRLQIEATIYEYNGHRNNGDKPQYIEGWISEFLNPLSGQRGPIVLPLPFPVPALYEVVLPEGAVIRSDVELSSPVIGHAEQGTVVSVIGCTYTEQPKDKCVARYRLAGNGGYINVKLNVPEPHNNAVVQFIGIDNQFNPNHPKQYHCDKIRSILSLQRFEEQNDIYNTKTLLSTAAAAVSTTVESLLPLQCKYYAMSSLILNVGKNNRITQLYHQRLQLQRHGANGDSFCDDDVIVQQWQHESTTINTPTLHNHKSSIKNTKQQYHHQQQQQMLLCVICLCEERTATIVHGETGHIACCLICARILKARGDHCPVCRLPIDTVIQHFWA